MRAGIGPQQAISAMVKEGLPRASGDRPAKSGNLGGGGAGCPVRAGIGPSYGNSPLSMGRLPRASGDRPLRGFCAVTTIGVAPCERG